jgi:hypothetical protein
VRAVITQTGVLAGRRRRALDSTLLDDAVATQDTVTQLVATVRRVRRLVPAAAMLVLGAHDYDHDPGKPACAWDDPEARTRLVSALVSDARVVLAAVQGADLDATQAEAVGLGGLVAGQDVEPGETEGTFRIARKVAADRVISTVDPDARHMHKSRSSYRDGYKAHLAVEPETGLVCAAALTPANAPGGRAVFDWRCGRCPLRERCTRAKDGKTVNLHPHEAELVAARRRATTPAFQASYRRWRPMVERSIAWLVANGHRRVRYRGLARNQLGLSVRVAAINLRRLIAMGLDHTDAGWVLA